MNQESTRLRLLRRLECGLCEDMARDLRLLRLAFEEVDIEEDSTLEQTYGESIPVLLYDQQEIARAPHTRRSLHDALARNGLV